MPSTRRLSEPVRVSLRRAWRQGSRGCLTLVPNASATARNLQRVPKGVNESRARPPTSTETDYFHRVRRTSRLDAPMRGPKSSGVSRTQHDDPLT